MTARHENQFSGEQRSAAAVLAVHSQRLPINPGVSMRGAAHGSHGQVSCHSAVSGPTCATSAGDKPQMLIV